MKLAELTPKQQEIIRAVVHEKVTSRKELSARFHCAEHTVRHHIQNIGQKVGRSTLLEILLELYTFEEKV